MRRLLYNLAHASAKTLPAQPGVPVRVEHEYERKGALNLFAAFDTRTGFVWGQTYERKRQEEFIAFLEYLDHQVPSHITTIHLVLDNLALIHFLPTRDTMLTSVSSSDSSNRARRQ
jgi:hypothetical protein